MVGECKSITPIDKIQANIECHSYQGQKRKSITPIDKIQTSIESDSYQGHKHSQEEADIQLFALM